MSNPPPSDLDAAPDPGLPALERLRERIEAAVAEIERLRTANAALAERVQTLADDAVARSDDSGLPTLTLEGDPADLRNKVESFIEAVDRMLAEPGTPIAEAEADAPDGEPSSESLG